MRLKSLYLQNFRIYESHLFEFKPKINLIYGSNALGKTSLLEAIYFLMTGRSFRTSQTSDLIRHSSDFFFLEAKFNKHDVEQNLKVYYSRKEQKIIYNNTSYPSFTSLFGILQGAIYHPDDVSIVKGSPSIRRSLLDLQIAQFNPLYLHYSKRYEKALQQRNFLLKKKSQEAIESWEFELSNAGAYLVLARGSALRDLVDSARVFHSHFTSNNEVLSLEYQPNSLNSLLKLDELRHSLLEQYKKWRKRELEIGFTLIGPHKDDFLILLNQQEARFFASEGQQRSSVAALRLGEWDLLKKKIEDAPLMLLDDVGIGLDHVRKNKLYEYSKTLDQVFLTSSEDVILEKENSNAIYLGS